MALNNFKWLEMAPNGSNRGKPWQKALKGSKKVPKKAKSKGEKKRRKKFPSLPPNDS